MPSSRCQMTLQPTWWNSLILSLWAVARMPQFMPRGSDPRKRISSRRATNGGVLLVGETTKKSRGCLQSRQKAMLEAVCFVHQYEDSCPLFGRSDKELPKFSNRPPLNVFSELADDSATNSGELFNPFFFGRGENATIYARGSDPRKRISSRRATNGELLLVWETMKKPRCQSSEQKKAMLDAVCFARLDEDLWPLFGRS
ncbi:hypothetical protein CEXT_255831 [Caerostris extrusa]|uniref:Uncharacterized protein n=1 Tax=Caerostris extrusa TaxID=172846 RepID=A0AAV4TGP6_CAEEX|nr:hypothetical protein CEXT_255831 [Caerostris extrusa]